MKEILESIILNIVANKEQVSVTETIEETAIIYEVKVAEEDIGRIIGKQGKDEKIFTLYKFRTMTDEKDEKGKLLPDSQRLTKFGKFLRSTSLDELPELINILKGDMSIVGPRPLLVEYLKLYNEEQKHRHDVRPGLTGLAQTSGRNAITWEEKFEKDIEYVHNISFIGDVKIIIKTAIKVFKREGISGTNSDTMQKFEGNKEKINV